jgi:hypothetical protein
MWMNGINSFFYVLSRNRFLQTIREDRRNQSKVSPSSLMMPNTHLCQSPFPIFTINFCQTSFKLQKLYLHEISILLQTLFKVFQLFERRSWFKFVIFRSEGAENWFLCFSILRRLKGWLHHKFIQILCFPFYLIEYQ